MKKMLSALLALSMVLALLPAGVFTASALQEGDYTYIVADSKALITGYTGVGGSINIPSVLGGYPVAAIQNSAFYHCTSLTGVTVPDCVLRIESSAFERCTSLKYAATGTGVTNIGDHAFNGCSALETVKLGRGILIIDEYAFFGCVSLKNITIPSGAVSIGDNAFSVCTSLAWIIIPASVGTIGANSFWLSGGVTFYGFDGSYAETYAAAKSIAFVDIYARIKLNGETLGATKAVKVKWYGLYKNESLQLSWDAVTGCSVHSVWTSDNHKKVLVDAAGKVTNRGIGARSANIALQLYDDYGNLIAANTVKVIFYKYNWQLRFL